MEIGVIAYKDKTGEKFKNEQNLYIKTEMNNALSNFLSYAIKTLLADMFEAEISQNAQNLHASAQNGVLPNNLSTETKHPRNF